MILMGPFRLGKSCDSVVPCPRTAARRRCPIRGSSLWQRWETRGAPTCREGSLCPMGNRCPPGCARPRRRRMKLSFPSPPSPRGTSRYITLGEAWLACSLFAERPSAVSADPQRARAALRVPHGALPPLRRSGGSAAAPPSSRRQFVGGCSGTGELEVNRCWAVKSVDCLLERGFMPSRYSFRLGLRCRHWVQPAGGMPGTAGTHPGAWGEVFQAPQTGLVTLLSGPWVPRDLSNKDVSRGRKLFPCKIPNRLF